MPTPTSLPRFSEQQEAALLRFDASWNNPGVQQLRAEYPSEVDEAFLLELIRIDAQKRVATGMTADEALYLEAFPMLQNDAALLQKVRAISFIPMQTGDSVLRALAATTPVLQQVNLPALDPQATTSESPSTLPEHRYKLEGEIARGGMGAVLRGRDEDLGREIAVKVMLQNHAGKTELLQRFVDEAQIAGQLQHPGITPVYELGRFPDQRPYFTMKLVRGETLAKLLKDRTDPASERPRFLKIFEQICQTLAYAHTRKVIHRDLKPHNIMVGSFGEVQVMDWGLAKVLNTPDVSGAMTSRPSDISEASEGSVQTKRSSGNSTDIPNTQTGSVLGTPAYMAPEQARGDIDQLDERADVFGLGAILCEVLTGQPPYVGESGLEIYRQAVDAELADAMKRLDQCGADRELVSLAKQCLSVNREDRPRDASELTKNLASYLHSVEERLKQAELTAVKATTKAEEESKRRRITLQLATGILLTLLAGLAASLWQMNRAMAAEELARENEGIAKDQRKQAIANADKATQERDRAEKEKANAVAVRDFLRNQLISRASVWEQSNLARVPANKLGTPRHDMTVRELLNLAAKEFSPETIEAKFPKQGEVQAEILDTIGEAYESVSDFEKAIRFIKAATDLRERIAGPEHPETLASHINLAFIYMAASRQGEAIGVVLKTLGRVESILEKGQSGVRDDASDQAMNSVLQAVERRLDLRRFHLPGITLGVAEGAMALLQVGKGLPRLKRFAELVEARYGIDDRRAVFAKLMVAFAHHAMGQVSTAISMYEQLLTVAQRMFADDNTMLIGLRIVLGISYYAQGVKPAETIKLFETSYGQLQRILGDNHPHTLNTAGTLAGVYQDNKRLPEAIVLLEKVSKGQEVTLGTDHFVTLTTQVNLAHAYHQAGRLTEAITLNQTVLQKERTSLGEEHRHTLVTMNNLASALNDANRLPEAIKLLEAARDVQVKRQGAGHSDTLATLNNLADSYQKAGRLPEAIKLFEQVCIASITRIGIGHRLTNISLNNLAKAYQAAGLVKQAEVVRQLCIDIRDKKHLPQWLTSIAQFTIGSTLLVQKKYVDAEPLLLKGFEGMAREKAMLSQDKLRLSEALDRLIQLYTETNKPDEVKKWQAEKAKLNKTPEKKP